MHRRLLPALALASLLHGPAVARGVPQPASPSQVNAVFTYVMAGAATVNATASSVSGIVWHVFSGTGGPTIVLPRDIPSGQLNCFSNQQGSAAVFAFQANSGGQTILAGTPTTVSVTTGAALRSLCWHYQGPTKLWTRLQ